jgi:hypothetical protein
MFLGLVLPGLLTTNAVGAENTARAEHVKGSYEGIGESYAQAIARTISAARAIAAEQFGYDMPDMIFVSVRAGGKERSQLYNDGQDRIAACAQRELGQAP